MQPHYPPNLGGTRGAPPFQRPGGFPPPGGGPGGPPAYSAGIRGAAVPPRGGQSNRTIWVGKIAPTVEPETMKEILQACGSLKEWKPVIGPNKGFGFATFHDSIGVLAAQKMLNGLELDGQCLLIKCNSATEEHVRSVVQERENAGLDVVPKEVEEKVLEVIERVVKNRKPVEHPSDAGQAATEFLSSLMEDTKQEEVKIDIQPPKSKNTVLQSKNSQRNTEDEKARKTRDALRVLEKNERERIRKFELEADKMRDLALERKRQILADNEGKDPKDEEPIFKRKPYRNSREHQDRKRRRDQELEQDLQDEEECRGDILQESKDDAGPSHKTETEPERRKEAVPSRKGFTFDEEEEFREKKEFIPLKYSKEEMAVEGVKKRSKSEKEQIESAKAKAMERIPKDFDAVAKYGIKWSCFDDAGSTVHGRIKSWIKKKIRELMGEEEESFCDFVFSQIEMHKGPSSVLESVKEVLDEDSDAFILKLFQVIVYETERIFFLRQIQ